MRTRSDDLEILLAVVDTGGFSAAAKTLDVQVAKVSRAVSRVETQLGVSLLNRTTRQVSITQEGQVFIDAVRSGLYTVEKAEEEIVEQGARPKGTLRVDAVSPFVLHQLIPLVQPFKRAYPDIKLEMTSNEGFVDLLEKRTDVAIRIGQLNDSTLHARHLGRSSLHIVASPEYLEISGRPESVNDLSQHCLIGFTGAKVLNEWPLKGMESISPDLSSSNGEAVRQLALAGNGIACLSGFMVNGDIESGRLVSLLESDLLANTAREQVNAVYYKSSAVSGRVSAFLNFIQPKLKL
ncbi:LysR family transcriptional regulator [Endozoicomonas arenosclerae]|uniref:LysR family transcriptional regulator n=1 Tax=Endozoicomonas arenosclerae TaxID=1633495 RepID=UPI0007819F56|nr:LysR family transcriptional regulator [Endozoicomonas arenosclerae]